MTPEKDETPSASWILAGTLSEFPNDTIVARELNGRSLIIVHSEGAYRCFNDECAHQPIKLSEFGELGRDSVLMCHAHGACFDLKNGGAVLCPPALEGLKSWSTRVEGSNLMISLGSI